MKIKETLITIAVIFLIFLLYLAAVEIKKSGRNEIKIEQFQERAVVSEAVINNQKETINVKLKQQKIIINNNVDDEYRVKWVQWLASGETSDSQ